MCSEIIQGVQQPIVEIQEVRGNLLQPATRISHLIYATQAAVHASDRMLYIVGGVNGEIINII